MSEPTPRNKISGQLLEMEKAVLVAFKAKRESDFLKDFGDDYIGIANDGVKSAADEVRGMRKLELTSLTMTDENIAFPAPDIALIIYTMKVEGRMAGKDISGPIYASTVYVHRSGQWKSVLHTESRGD